MPRYVKRSACLWMCVGGGAEPQPTFCSFVFIREVCRSIVDACISGHCAGHSVNRTASRSVSRDLPIYLIYLIFYFDLFRRLDLLFLLIAEAPMRNTPMHDVASHFGLMARLSQTYQYHCQSRSLSLTLWS